ncbi:MAG: NAD(P)/FAD-dependent oxidoreductase [Spirochaetia bacterium]|jgi:glycerol-3-phosphate dehydrogenase|nr:NAD(P)/FAD-dependent oxidoreductase [Spirochaetia bacterium]
MYDYVIIGAGVVGCSIARELSKYKADVCILEKSDDVASGASKANSGIIHGGYAAKHGTLKGRLNVLGNRMFDDLNKQLNFGYRKTGGLVIGFDDNDLESLKILLGNGIKNGVQDLRIIQREEILRMEPNLNPEVKYALYAGDVGVTSPYEYTIALAENSITNGVNLFLNSEVMRIERKDNFFELITEGCRYKARTIINASGVYSDSISRMVGVDYFSIIPRKGQYILFQKGTGSAVNSVIFQVPSDKGKGILVTSTFHGNLMLGPNSEEVADRDDTVTNELTLDYVIDAARKSLPDFNLKERLKTFSGIRPTPSTGDFIIKEEFPGFINVAGIESPGLTSSPAIAEMVLGIIRKRTSLEKKKNFNPLREPIIKHNSFDPQEVKRRVELTAGDDRVVCRCERVTEGEIRDALRRNIEVNTIKAVKMRTRAGMGLCQGKFCSPRVDELIGRINK